MVVVLTRQIFMLFCLISNCKKDVVHRKPERKHGLGLIRIPANRFILKADPLEAFQITQGIIWHCFDHSLHIEQYLVAALEFDQERIVVIGRYIDNSAYF